MFSPTTDKNDFARIYWEFPSYGIFLAAFSYLDRVKKNVRLEFLDASLYAVDLLKRKINVYFLKDRHIDIFISLT